MKDTPHRCLTNGEEIRTSRLAALRRTIRADDQFRGNLPSFTSRVVSIFSLGLLARDLDHDGVGPRPIRVLPAASLDDKVLTRGTRRNDALTQLTAKHRVSRWKTFGVAHVPIGAEHGTSLFTTKRDRREKLGSV